MVGMVGRLDLRYRFVSTKALGGGGGGKGGMESEEEETMVPSMPMDQEVLLSLTAFWEGLLHNSFYASTQVRHAPLTAPLLVRLSLAHPAVSALYRLLALLLRALESTSALHLPKEDEKWEGREEGQDAMDVITTSPSSSSSKLISPAETRALHRLLSHYLPQVLRRLDTYQDELLASALAMLLSSPLLLLPLPRLLPALRQALTTGTAHIPTARVAAEALERWQQAAREEGREGGKEGGKEEESVARAFEAALPRVLPLLDLYLHDAAGGREGGRGGASRAETEAFQKRLLRFLGRLGGRNQALITPPEELEGGGEEGGEGGIVPLSLPFQDTQVPTVEVDVAVLLPRLLRLAERKGDAQAKVLASEAIHALVLYLVGQSASSSSSSSLPSSFSSTTPTTSLLCAVFPTLLRLALDLNSVTRQLFSKLVPQLVHWFAKARTEHPETLALLDALTAGAAGGGGGGGGKEGRRESGPVRRLCASTLAEFVQYAIKQSSKKEMASSPVAVEALLSRLERLARHPNRCYRVGGALALGQSVRYLREETALVRLYALRLLQTTLVALRLGHRGQEEEGGEEEGGGEEEEGEVVGKVVDALVKLLCRYLGGGMDHAELLKSVSARKEGAGAAGPASLEEMVEWVWSHAGAIEPAFRSKCLGAFLALVPLLAPSSLPPSTSSSARTTSLKPALAKARAWVLVRGQAETVRTIEGPAVAHLLHQQQQQQHHEAATPTKKKRTAHEEEGAEGGAEEEREEQQQQQHLSGSLAAVTRSLETLTAALDGYLWLFSRRILRPAPYLAGTEAFASTPSFLPSSSSPSSSEKKRPREEEEKEGEEEGVNSLFCVHPSSSNILSCIYAVLVSVWDHPPCGGREGGREGGKGGGYEEAFSLAPSQAIAIRHKSALALVRALDFLSLLLEEKGDNEGKEGGPASSSSSSSVSSPPSLLLAKRIVAAGLWTPQMQRLLAWCLFQPWGLHTPYPHTHTIGNFNRPEEDDVVSLLLPEAGRRLLRHWRLLDEAAATAAATAGDSASVPPSLTQTLHDMLSAPSSSLHPASLPLSLPTSDLEGKQWVLRGTSTLHALGLLEQVLGGREGGREGGEDSTVLALARSLLQQLADPSFPSDLSPNARRTAGSILLLAVALGLPLSSPSLPFSSSSSSSSSSTTLMNTLLDARREGGREGGLSRGEMFQRRFAPEIAEILAVGKEGRECLAGLLSLVSEEGGREGGREERVRSLFLEVVEWLLTRPAMLDQEATAVLTLCLRAPFFFPSPSSPPSLPSSLAMNHLALLRRLLRLEASLPPSLRVGAGQDPRIQSLLLSLLQDHESDVGVKCAALELLPQVVLPGVGREEGGREGGGEKALLEAVEEGVTAGRFFPMEGSRQWAKEEGGGGGGGGGGEATTTRRRQDANYLLLLRALLQAVAGAGNWGLALATIHHFGEGKRHRFYPLLRSALEGMVGTLLQAPSSASVAAAAAAAAARRRGGEGGKEGGKEELSPALGVAAMVWETILNKKLRSHAKKLLLLDDVLLPLLQFMPLLEGGLLAFLGAPPPSASAGREGGRRGQDAVAEHRRGDQCAIFEWERGREVEREGGRFAPTPLVCLHSSTSGLRTFPRGGHQTEGRSSPPFLPPFLPLQSQQDRRQSRPARLPTPPPRGEGGRGREGGRGLVATTGGSGGV